VEDKTPSMLVFSRRISHFALVSLGPFSAIQTGQKIGCGSHLVSIVCNTITVKRRFTFCNMNNVSSSLNRMEKRLQMFRHQLSVIFFKFALVFKCLSETEIRKVSQRELYLC
jgi:hypothetical protein